MKVDEGQIILHTMDGMSLVRLIGDVDLSTATSLRATFEEALAASPRVIVDLSRVGAVDSIGLGILVTAVQVARRNHGDVLLAAAPPFFISVLRAARLNTTFTTYDTVPRAMTAATTGCYSARPWDTSSPA